MPLSYSVREVMMRSIRKGVGGDGDLARERRCGTSSYQWFCLSESRLLESLVDDSATKS